MSREVLRYDWQSEEQTQRTICKKLHCKYYCTLTSNHVNSFNHCFWKLRFWAPTVTYGNEKPEGRDQQLINTSIRTSQGNSNEVINIIFTTQYLTGRLWARAGVTSISFSKVSFSWWTPFLLALYNYKRIHFFSHSSDYHGTRNSNYRRNKPIVKHCATRAEFLRHSTGVPNLGYMYPQGTFSYLKGYM